MLYGNAARIALGEPPAEPTPPRGSDVFSQPMIFARIHGYLSMATPLLWMRQQDTFGVLGLALNACEERNGAAADGGARADPRADRLRSRRLGTVPDIEDERERVNTVRLTFRLLHVADIVAVTPGA